MGSWRTSLAGALSALGILLPAIAAAIDGNPATDPNWGMVIPAVIGSIGLLFARDNKVSSEAAGAK